MTAPGDENNEDDSFITSLMPEKRKKTYVQIFLGKNFMHIPVQMLLLVTTPITLVRDEMYSNHCHTGPV
jgi:hypothetical protein